MSSSIWLPDVHTGYLVSDEERSRDHDDEDWHEELGPLETAEGRTANLELLREACLEAREALKAPASSRDLLESLLERACNLGPPPPKKRRQAEATTQALKKEGGPGDPKAGAAAPTRLRVAAGRLA